MKTIPKTIKVLFLGLILAIASCSGEEEERTTGPDQPVIPVAEMQEDPADFVNPFIGTGGHGHTYPGATLPFGMVQLSPDTRLDGWDGCSGYHFSDSVVYGFSHTHLSGTGVSDYGDILFMPMTSSPTLDNGAQSGPEKGYSARFSKADELAVPGYYATRLAEENIRAELTASLRCGVHRYTFEEGGPAYVILDLRHRDQVLDASLRVYPDGRVEGHRISNAWASDQRVYFSARFSQVPSRSELYLDGKLSEKQEIEGQDCAAIFAFDTDPGTSLEIKVGISAVSIANAADNLEQEVGQRSFDEVKDRAFKVWNEELSKVQVLQGDAVSKRIFYTALYHSFLAPNLFSDQNGEYRGMDGKTHQLEKGQRQYTVFSLWDTFRATHPLYTLVQPERTDAFIRTFIRQYEEGGILPIWELAGNYTGCMIGYHAIPVIADAYAKGYRGFDAEKALKAMVHSARQQHLGLSHYQEQGFIGAGDEAESVSKTLEYAYDDWCIATMAAAMGKQDLAAEFGARAQYWKNLLDPETGFFRARMNGSWQGGFDPREVNFNFTEANAWQYSAFVPQDIHGLIALKGGPEAFEAHLDSLFVASSQTTGREQADITGLIGQYAHGNEPSHHMAYLYHYVGAPHKGQALLHQVMTELYHDAPDGLSGNEDCGQMSSWYVLSALGFYPVTPGSDLYVLGIPRFEEAVVNLGTNRRLRILAEGWGPGKRYVSGIRWQGQALDRLYLRHEELMQGGELIFEMSDEPSEEFAARMQAPPALEKGAPIGISPYFMASSQTFTDSLELRIGCADATAQVMYELNGAAAVPYSGPLTLDQTSTLRAWSVGAEGQRSKPLTAEYFKIEGGRSIRLGTEYANQYAAAGDEALIDYLRGGPNFRTGFWQGYREDLRADVDLGEVKSVTELGLSCLQDIKSWIWMPLRVRIEVSTDGQTYRAYGEAVPQTSDRAEGSFVEELVVRAPAQVRYIRLVAEHYGVCPPWHLGAGGKAWLFADEIIVR